MFELRDYQQRAIDEARHKVAEGHKRIILESPTGSGKTVIAAHLIKQATDRNKSCLFLAHTRELVHQCSDKLMQNDIPHGVIMAGVPRNSVPPTQVASKDTLYSRAVRQGIETAPQADLVILDECHRSLAMSWMKLIEKYPDAVVIGLSATPSRPSDGKGMGDLYTSMVKVATYEELIAQGHLVKSRIFAPYRPDLKGVRAGYDYNKEDLQKRMDRKALIGNIIHTWEQHASQRQTVVFASGIQHSMHLRDRFREAGVAVEHIDGDMDSKERDWIIWRFQQGEIQVLCNCNVLCEVFDAPPCSCAVLARPTKSLNLYRQMSGRIQRPYPHKEDALIIDHSGNVYEHGFPDEDVVWTLTPSVRIEKEVRRQREKRESVIVCVHCGFCYTSERYCPVCGQPAPVRRVKIVQRPGQLGEVKRRHALREATQEDLQGFWDECVGKAIGRNQKIGAAYHMYRSRYGVGPNCRLVRVPRGKREWNMKALEFYREVIKK